MPANSTPGKPDFHFEINSFAEFVQFVLLVSKLDQNLDDATLLELTARLQKATTGLSNAENADAAHTP